MTDDIACFLRKRERKRAREAGELVDEETVEHKASESISEVHESRSGFVRAAIYQILKMRNKKKKKKKKEEKSTLSHGANSHEKSFFSGIWRARGCARTCYAQVTYTCD